ncbi:hypothetical protein EAH76_14815 [Sphingomonas glacialis]|uniref:Uncharacterized protein n=1 Tax=Sphingomonas glacialis TaxID=658225 RepID=A0A502FRI5_9SPHN|nr:hypothetical protein EAH76_14815 [Sphingomonas glacialis]
MAKLFEITPALHFVGFRSEEYHSAVRIWGKPDFVHPAWDRWAQQDIHPVNTVIFARGLRRVQWPASTIRTVRDQSHNSRPLLPNRLFHDFVDDGFSSRLADCATQVDGDVWRHIYKIAVVSLD